MRAGGCDCRVRGSECWAWFDVVLGFSGAAAGWVDPELLHHRRIRPELALVVGKRGREVDWEKR